MVGDDRAFAKAADEHQLLQFASIREPGAALAVKGDRLRPICQIGLAQDRQVAVAIEAMAAMRVPRQDDMVANRDAARLGPDFLDNAGRLVTEHNRHRIVQRAGDDFEIGVTEPGRFDAHQYIVASKPVDDDRLDA